MCSDPVRRRLEHIIDNADWIADYLFGCDLAQFLTDRKTIDAVERCLERIAEAVVQIGAREAETLGLPVPFNDVRSLGNRLRHEYSRIDTRVIYDTGRFDIPPLREAARRVLEKS